jgi:hypothetical protein
MRALKTCWCRSVLAGITNTFTGTKLHYRRHGVVVSKRRKRLETVCEDVVHIQLASSCEHDTDNETSGSMTDEEILEDLSGHQAPMMNSAPPK